MSDRSIAAASRPFRRPSRGGVVLAAGVLLGLVPAAFAGDEKPAPGAMPGAPAGEPGSAGAAKNSRFFDTYDANQDGKVTKDEYTGDPTVFDVIDADHDGVVTLAELGVPADYRPQPLPKAMDERVEAGRGGGALAERLEKFKVQLAGWDLDKDGKVSKEEYKGKVSFELMDRNKDGVITIEDLRQPGGDKKGGGMPGLPTPDEMRQRFKDADRNGDGKVTREEFPGPPERFDALDKDKDGAITADEVETAMREGAGGEGGRGKRMFQRFDKNGDGKVSRDEFPGGDDGFQRMDKNGDGAITPDEVEGLARLGKEGKGVGNAGRKPPTPGDGKPSTPGEGAMPSEGAMPPPPAAGGGLGTLFAALDRDRDGRLSRAEFPGTDDEWRRLDRNANGWIEADEAK